MQFLLDAIGMVSLGSFIPTRILIPTRFLPAAVVSLATRERRRWETAKSSFARQGLLKDSYANAYYGLADIRVRTRAALSRTRILSSEFMHGALVS